MICISGWAGTGKDETAGRLVKVHGAIQTGLADPGKRHCLDTYGFSWEQLWGPSKFRNAGDKRYPKPALKEFGFRPNGDGTWTSVVDAGNRDERFRQGKGAMGPYLQFMYAAMKFSETQTPQVITVKDDDPAWFLSPRELLQLYLELLNTLYADTWIDKGIADHRKIAEGGWAYSQEHGLVDDHSLPTERPDLMITCYSDFRHIHEHRKARLAADGQLVPVLIRVKRPTVTKAPFNHRSETEQTRLRDAAYDFIIDNSGTLEDLRAAIDGIVQKCSDPGWNGKAWSEDYVLPHESETYQP